MKPQHLKLIEGRSSFAKHALTAGVSILLVYNLSRFIASALVWSGTIRHPKAYIGLDYASFWAFHVLILLRLSKVGLFPKLLLMGMTLLLIGEWWLTLVAATDS